MILSIFSATTMEVMAPSLSPPTAVFTYVSLQKKLLQRGLGIDYNVMHALILHARFLCMNDADTI